MTSLVGIYCKDGIVIGADSSATFSHGNFNTIQQKMEKIEIIGGKIILTGVGSVGMGQRFKFIVNDLNEKGFFNKKTTNRISKELSQKMIMNMKETGIDPGSYGALIAFPAENHFHLCQFDRHQFQPEFLNERLWYCSMGTPQYITDPFLGFIREVFWGDGLPTVEEAIFATTWTIDHAIKTSPSDTRDPISIAVLQNNGLPKARLLNANEIEEKISRIESMKNVLRNHNFTSPNVPEPPTEQF